MCLSSATNIVAYYLLKTKKLEEIMKTGPRGHWWDHSFIRMNDNQVSKTQSSVLVERNEFILFLMCLILATNIITYYLLKTVFSVEIMKTGPRGHWWVCSFNRINDNHVPKRQSILLVERNIFIFFTNDFILQPMFLLTTFSKQYF